MQKTRILIYRKLAFVITGNIWLSRYQTLASNSLKFMRLAYPGNKNLRFTPQYLGLNRGTIVSDAGVGGPCRSDHAAAGPQHH